MRASRVRRYRKEEKDQPAVETLRRIDAIGLRLMVAAAIIIAFACAVGAVGGPAAGYGLVGMILVLSVLRFILFCGMYRRDA